MKYKKYKIIVFFCLILFPFSSVFAGNCLVDVTLESNAKYNYNITYEITEFKVTKNYVTFAGWAALNHMDNYGGKNREAWIVAYSGEWSEVYREDPTNPGCKRGKKCYSVDISNDYRNKGLGQDYNLYFMRCTDGACGNKSGYERAVKNGKWELNSCLGGNGGTGLSEGGHCVYKNIEFNTKLSWDTLKKNFDNSDDVKFRIVVKVTGKQGRIMVPKIDSSDIGFYPDACKNIFGESCRNSTGRETYSRSFDENIKSGDIEKTITVKKSITIGGMSNEVTFTATNAAVYCKKGKRCSYRYALNRGMAPKNDDAEFERTNNCFTFGETFTVDDKMNVGIYRNYKSTNAPVRDTFHGRLIKISGAESGWAWTSWVKSSGSLTLNFKEEIEEKCVDIAQYCIGSGCGQYDSKTCSYSNTPEPVNLVKPDCNGDTHSSCDSWQKNLTCGKTIDSTYYYKISVEEFKSKTNGKTIEINSSKDVRLTNEGGTKYYYFLITFSANVNYTQNINLQLQGFSNGSTVKAGRSVNFAYNYLNQISWNFAGTYSENTSENNTYKNTINVSFDSGSSSNVLPIDTILVSLKPGEDYLYADAKPNSQKILYNVNFYYQFARGLASNNLQDLDSNNAVGFRDSNDAKKSDFTQNYGTFKNGTVDKNNWLENDLRIFRFIYQINQAYFKANGSGEVKYSALDLGEKEYVKGDVGSKYYVPINASGNSFPFVSVNFDNLSLIDGATLSYNAQCSVNINNAINKIRYRSIDVTVPFPNNNIPKNWKEYSQFDSSFSRLKNQNISYETLFLKNRFSDLKSTLGDYSKYDDMTNDGNSKFITEDKFSTRQGKHCKSGEYSVNCDKAQ